MALDRYKFVEVVETDYKRTQNDWTTLIRSGIERLYAWTRHNAQVPTGCMPSLRLGTARLWEVVDQDLSNDW
jgi:hypothetical protein